MKVTSVVSIFLLGNFDCRLHEQSLEINLARKTRAMLAYLASSNIPHSRQTLTNLFCQEAQDPAGTLRWHLSRIRRQIIDDILIVDSDIVKFNHTVGWVDHREFQTVLNAVDRQRIDQQQLVHILGLYRGEFLSGLNLPDAPEFEIWLLAVRTRFQQLYERGLMVMVDYLIENNQYADALEWAQKLLQSNSLLETAHGRVMWLYAQMGQREAALNQFGQCRELLRRELAVEPTDELIQLHQQILTGHLRRVLLTSSSDALIKLEQHDPSKHTLILGREQELSQLHQAWGITQRQGSAVILIEAEAGGGKTVLVEEFSRQLSIEAFLVGHCYESSQNMPYRPWIDILLTRIDQLDDSTLISVSSYWLEQLSRLLPSLAVRINYTPHRHSGTFSGSREHLFSAVVELLVRIPDAQPIVLFLDDLQWADEASIGLFHYIAQRPQRAGDTPVLLLGAYRPEEADDNASLMSLVHDLRHMDALKIIQLPPMSSEQIEPMIAHLWADLPSRFRASQIRDELLQQTGGNPLFVSEILNELKHIAELPSTLPIPPSLDELIQRRMRQLTMSERQVLEALAVLDTSATLAQTQQSSGRSEDETITAIDQGLRWRLLEGVVDRHPPQFDFRHDLMREAILAQISLARRQRLHRRVATTLLESGAPSATLAYHWHMADDIEQEGQYVAQAGEEAVTVHANDEAIRYLQRALEIISDPPHRAQLLIKLGDIQQLIGQWTEAQACYQQSLELAEQCQATATLAQGQLQLGWLRFDEGDVSEALACFEQSRDNYKLVENPRGVADALNGIGQVMMQRGEFAKAIEYCEQQRQIAIDSGDQLVEGKALGNLGIIFIYQNDYRTAVKYMHESLQLLLKFGEKRSVAINLGNLAALYQTKLHDYEQALEFREQGLKLCFEIGDMDGVSLAFGNNSALYHKLGNYDLALDYAKHELAIGLEMGNHPRIGTALVHFGDIYVEQKQFDKAEYVYQHALRLWQTIDAPYLHCQYLQHPARLLFLQQRYTEAQELNKKALAIAKEVERHEVIFNAQVLDIQLKLALGQVDNASAIHDLQQLLDAQTDDEYKASLHYELWHLETDVNKKNLHKENIILLYKKLYEQSQNIDCYSRYQELTGVSLQFIPTPLREPPSLNSSSVTIDDLLAQVDQMIDAQSI